MKQSHRLHNRYFVLILLANVIATGTRSIIPPLTTTLRQLYSTLPSDEPIGVLIALAALFAGLSGLVWGILADRLSKRRLLWVSTAAWGGINLLSAIPAISFGGFVTCQLASAFFIGALVPVGYAITAEIYPKERHGVFFGWLATGANLGFGVGYLLGGFLSTADWWNLPFLIVGCAGVAISLAFGWFPVPVGEISSGSLAHSRSSPSNSDSETRPDQVAPPLRLSGADVKMILRTPLNVQVCVIAFFAVIPNTAFAGWFIRFLFVDHGIGEENGTVLMLLVFASQLAGVVLLGALADRFEKQRSQGRFRVLLWATALGTICTITALFLPFWFATPDFFAYFTNASFSAFFLLLFAGNFFTAVIGSITMVVMVNHNPKHLQASVVAVNNVFQTIGAAFALYFCSAIATYVFGGLYAGAFIVINLLYTPCIVLTASILKRSRHHKSPDLIPSN